MRTARYKSPVGGVREWTNRTVSKTVVSQGTVGSNPTPSARVTELPAFKPGWRRSTADPELVPSAMPHELHTIDPRCSQVVGSATHSLLMTRRSSG
jgi:hypothetical protein